MDKKFTPSELIDIILDKINKNGHQSLSFDEKTYLKNYNNINKNTDFESWLCSSDDSTFSDVGDKLLFDEFEGDEDIFYNHKKLKRVLSKHLNQKPFSNNADWSGGYVWNVKLEDKFHGKFIYLGDDELLLLNRVLINDEYIDEIIKYITSPKELYYVLLNLKR